MSELRLNDVWTRGIRSVRFRSRRFLYDFRQAVFFARLATRRRRRLKDELIAGVTVVAVSWNTRDQVAVLLSAIARFTDGPFEVIIVDNASVDGTIEYLGGRADVRTIRLSRNWGHGLALDTGVQAARTRYVITLDIDAFPIAHGWVDAAVGPLEHGYTLAGAFSSGYIHPCYMAIERQRFLEKRYTFAASYSRRLRIRRKGQPKSWDAGKLITVLDPGPHHRIEVSSVRGPGALGTVFGGLVYHHFYSTRLTGKLTGDVIRSGVTPAISAEAWDEAVRRYLGVPDV